ncbi:MAG TPA: molybdenum cofactor guanylyltransferase [Thermoplasmata archaeon]
MRESVDTALILAGGSSTRFRAPKALVKVAGKPMVQRVFEAVSPFADQVIVSIADASMADALRRFISSAEYAVDERRGMGPVEGIRRGSEIARGERLLVAPCDAPLLRPGLYRLLLEVLEAYDAAVPKLEVLDPVRAVYRRTRIMEILEGDRTVRSPSALVDRLNYVSVGPDRIRSVDPDLSSFVDVNSRADLDDVLRRMRASEAARDTH